MKKQKEIYYRQITHEILFLPKCQRFRRKKEAAPKDLKRILPISRLLVRSLLRAFISSFLFRGFSLNVETASHYRSFVARDVNKRDVKTRGGGVPPKKSYSSKENRLSVAKLILILLKSLLKLFL